MALRRWGWLDGRVRMVRRIAEPALVCDARGTIRTANRAATELIGDPTLLPRDWGLHPQPMLGDRPALRVPLMGGDQLFIAHPESVPPTARIYRSMRDTLYRVISTIAHDLRSPLSSLVFNLGMLRQRWRTLPPEEVERTIDSMSRACELQTNAVAELVEQVSAEDGRSSDLGVLFERIAELLSPLFRDQENHLHISVARGLHVAAAPMVLEQIFVNLIRNAIESRTAPVVVVVQAQAQAHRVAVRVQNDGPPIPESQRTRIFTPFFSTKPTGTGMGLVFAREAARDLGGDLRILPSETTIFEVVLPLDAATGRTQPSGPGARMAITRKGA